LVRTKGIELTRKKWDAAIPRVAEAYKAGVEATTDQNEKAIAGEALYAARVSEAISNGSRVKGLQASSNDKWQKAAARKGAERIGRGMEESKEKFASGMAEVLSTIESVSLPARTADPVANVQNRVVPIAKALYDMKRR